MFQLIRGGRDPELRRQPTLAILPLLASRNLLPADTVRELAEAYRFLRNLEHRLQYLDDQQTHVLPQSDADRALIADAMGYGSDYAGFSAVLGQHRGKVARHFGEIFAVSPGGEHTLTLVADQPDAEKSFAALPPSVFASPGSESRWDMRLGSRYREMPARASSARPPGAARHRGRRGGEDPDATLDRLLDLLQSDRPARLLSRVARGVPAGPVRLAAMRARAVGRPVPANRPILLDELLAPARFTRSGLAHRCPAITRPDGRRRRRHRRSKWMSCGTSSPRTPCG